jgi:hypothetical protein
VNMGNGCCIFGRDGVVGKTGVLYSVLVRIESGSNGVIRLDMVSFHDFMRT